MNSGRRPCGSHNRLARRGMVLLAVAAPFGMNDGVAEAADDDSARTRRLEQIEERTESFANAMLDLSVAMREIRSMHTDDGAPAESPPSTVAAKAKARKPKSKTRPKGKAA